jgi:hypothetical protein
MEAFHRGTSCRMTGFIVNFPISCPREFRKICGTRMSPARLQAVAGLQESRRDNSRAPLR